MGKQTLLDKYKMLNVHYKGICPTLGPDVKCVQCDGCDRVITFAVFHSEYNGGVDVCNFCRIAAEKSRDGRVSCSDRKRSLCFTKHPLCFVGLAPLPKRYKLDIEEVEVENSHELLRRRFGKSVDVIADGDDCCSRKPVSGRGGGASDDKASRRRCALKLRAKGRKKVAHDDLKEETKEEEEEEEEKVGGWKVERQQKEIDQTVARRGLSVGSAETPPQLSASAGAAVEPAPRHSTSSQHRSPPQPLQQADFPMSVDSTAFFSVQVDDEQRGNVTNNVGNRQSLAALGENGSDWRAKLWRISESSIAKFFLHIEPYTRTTTERPSSEVRQPLCALDRDNNIEITIAPNTSCRFSRGFIGLTSCNNVRCVRIIPTTPDVGLWFSVMCEDECSTRLEIWHCSFDVTASFFFSLGDARGVPQRKYCVQMGRYVAESMDWLPVPLHREGNNTLGLCTFIRGHYLVSTVLPREVDAGQFLSAAGSGGGGGDVDGSGCCVYLTAEVCGATLLKHGLQLVEARWSSNGTSIADTFLFTIGRCTSVVVLRPTDDISSGRLTLQVVHFIEAKGVAAPPFFLPLPPFTIGAARNGHTLLAVAHGTSVACYQAPEFSTQLFVAAEDVVCSMRFHEHHVVAGLASGVIVDVNTGETMTKLESPALLIDCVAGPRSSDETLFFADASGRCTQVCRGQLGKEFVEKSSFLLCRSGCGTGRRATLVLGNSGMNEPPRTGDGCLVQFEQHPLRRHVGFCGPLLSVFSDGVWVLMLGGC